MGIRRKSEIIGVLSACLSSNGHANPLCLVVMIPIVRASCTATVPRIGFWCRWPLRSESCLLPLSPTEFHLNYLLMVKLIFLLVEPQPLSPSINFRKVLTQLNSLPVLMCGWLIHALLASFSLRLWSGWNSKQWRMWYGYWQRQRTGSWTVQM